MNAYLAWASIQTRRLEAFTRNAERVERISKWLPWRQPAR